MKPLAILIVDDEELIRQELREFFSDKPYLVFEASSPSEVFETMERETVDIVLLDLKLPEMDGLEVLRNIKNYSADIEVIMMTGHGDSESVIQALRLGAHDFFTKPLRLFDIQRAIERTEKFVNLQTHLNRFKNNFSLISRELQDSVGQFIGLSPAIKSVIETALKASQSSDTSVLITGPSGTGKELLARTIHYSSPRGKNYFYPLNCSAIPESLIESELFGHVKGAFTHAVENKTGCFEATSGGTLFLDEVGDMPLSVQSKVLRVLENQIIRKIGSHTDVKVDVRIIAATNKNIKKMVQHSKFRLDLLYRLNTLEIFVPPLSQRKEDISILLDHFIQFFSRKLNKTVSGVDETTLKMLTGYSFPGNVRELKNMVERAVLLSGSKKLSIADFPSLESVQPKSKKDLLSSLSSLDLNTMEKELILEALKRSRNNKAQAAKLLNISWYSLNRKLKKLNIS